MRARMILMILAAGTLVPGVSLAQADQRQAEQFRNEQRMREADQRLREFELRQRIDQQNLRLDNLEERQRTEANIRSVEDVNRNLTQLQPVAPVLRGGPTVAVDLEAQKRLGEAELQAGNAHLRALAAQAAQ